jgi:molybdopterin converting factor small subunit
MPIIVRVPTQLRQLTAGVGEITLEAQTVGEALTALDVQHPGFGERLFDDAGALRRFVNVFLADEDVRFLEGLATPTPENSVISIVPAVAGGSI